MTQSKKNNDEQTELAALRAEIDTLHRIIELLPGNVYWKDKQGKFLGVNNNVAKIAGLQSPSDLIGKTTLDLFPGEIGRLAHLNDQEVLATGIEHSFEEIGPNTKNQPAIYLSKKMPFYNSSGEIMGTLGIALDISERKKMEEELKIAKEKAEASNRVKSQFVAAVNHELRTPLASIIGLVDLLKDEVVQTAESKKIIDSIENCAQHLLSLVNDVLDFSKIETGKHRLIITPIYFEKLISEVCMLMEPLANNKNLALTLEIDPTMPACLLSDARILRHILLNLIGNAIKYTEKGQITIKVAVLKQNKQHAQLKVSILDTGTGIPAEHYNLLFKPFQQLADPKARPSSRNGTGLGLSIVKKLAEMIDATINVESELGKGSIFSFSAKFAIQNEKITANCTAPLVRNHQLRVLVVEDDPIIQYIHKKLLVNLDCQVDVVPDAEQALRILNVHHDIIFLDLNMPTLNGHDLIKIIRDTTSINCPIVIISAFIDKDEEIACMQAGANDFVRKPISQAKLKELLMRHCRYSPRIQVEG